MSKVSYTTALLADLTLLGVKENLTPLPLVV